MLSRIGLICSLVVAVATPSCTRQRAPITLSTYSQLSNGMSYSEVAHILGGPGMLSKDADGGGSTDNVARARQYEWRNPDGSAVYAVFAYGALVYSGEDGLRSSVVH
jgi:hypothetical protein